MVENPEGSYDRIWIKKSFGVLVQLIQSNRCPQKIVSFITISWRKWQYKKKPQTSKNIFAWKVEWKKSL